MMVNGVQSFNPYGAGRGAGAGDPRVQAKINAQPWMQSGLGAQGYFQSLNPQQQYDALNSGGKGSLHGALLNSGVSGNQLNQFINGAAYHGGDNGNLDPSVTFGSYNGAVNTGTGLQRGANFGASMFDGWPGGNPYAPGGQQNPQGGAGSGTGTNTANGPIVTDAGHGGVAPGTPGSIGSSTGTNNPNFYDLQASGNANPYNRTPLPMQQAMQSTLGAMNQNQNPYVQGANRAYPTIRNAGGVRMQ